MNFNTILALVAALFSAGLAVVVVCRSQRSLATWCFSAGMLIFALESVFGAIESASLFPERAAFWETLVSVAKSFLPAIWLIFSLTYSRANYHDFLVRSRWLIMGAFLVPVLSLAALYTPLFDLVAYDPLGSNVAQQGYFKMTGWTLLNPTGGVVPDGGTTLMLLGAALGALSMTRRFLRF